MRQFILLVVLVLFTFSLNSWGRRPAIEPQMEVANEFQTTPPKLAKGFAFTENINRAPSAVQNSSPNTETTTATTMLVLFLLGAPLILWSIIQWKSRQKSTTSNVVKLHSTEKEDTDWPKAS